IKVALSLHHERIPPHLHFIHPNPAIDFETLRLRVPTRMQSWQRGSAPRLAGINGFGYGGANAHVIVQEAPLPQRAPTPSVPRTRAFRNEPTGRRGASDVEPAVAGAPCVQTSPTADASPDRMSGRLPILLPLSARSVEGLRQSAAHLADWLEAHPDIEPAEVAGFLAHRREHFEVRATVCQSSDRELVQDLRMVAASTSEELVGRLSVNGLERGIAMVCSGQGPQWWAMGRGMLKYSPAFRSVIRQCDREFARWADWSLWTELTRSQNESRMHQTSISQPCLFALQIALARVWESWGIVPTVVLGHSVGEIAAAYISGALDFSDACRVAFHRGRTMDQATSRGAMIAAGVSPEEVPQWIAGFEQHVALAAVNGPSSVTISGDADAIEQVAQRLESSGVFCRRLAVEYAFHSPQMEPVRAPLLESLASICPRPTRIPFLSTVTGDFLDGTELTAEYWWRNVRQGVRFADAMYALAESGYEAVIELGPHPVLAYSIQECFQSRGRRVHSIGSLNRQQNDLLSMSKGLGDVYTCGFDIRWEGFYNRPSRRLEVPAYPFQLQRCWQESPQSRRARTLSSGHAWLGQPSDGAEPSWRNRVDLAAYPCLRDHALKAGVVYPAAAAVETMLAAAQRVTGAEQVRLESIQIDRACVLDDANPQYLDTKYDADRRRVELAFRPVDQDQGWQRLATGQVSRAPIAPAGASETAELGRIKQQCNESFDGARLYDYCERLGLFYGPAFRGVACGWRAAGQAVVEVETSAELLHEEVLPLNFHPATLDACFHAMIAADPSFDHTLDGLYLPSKIDRVELLRPAGDRLVVQARMLSKNQHRMRCDLMIFDAQGQVCMRIFGFESVRVASGHTEESVTDLVYAYRWIESEAAQRTAREDGDRSLALPSAEPHDQQAVVLPQPAVQAESTDTVDVQAWMICMDEGSVGRMLARQLRDAGYSVFEVYSGSSRVPQAVDGPHCLIDIETPAEYDRALEMAATALGSQVQGIVYLWGLDVPANDTLDEDQLHRSTQLTTLAPLFLVQALERREQAKPVRLVMVTAGAQSADDVPAVDAVAATPLIGFGRVVISECAKLSSKLVDLPASPQPGDITNLIWELQGDDDEDEIMWRQGRRWVRRFLPQREMPLPHDAQQSVRYRLSRGATANIDQLRFGTDACCELEPGQVEIEVQAASLNFSDVMKALDLYPGMPDGPPELGAECSGRIVRIGRGCPFQIGDEVVAIARGSFASHVVVDAALVAPKPPHLSHVEAAALPVAFLTAEYALQHCARLASGDKVLVHAATGGVGLAAIQLAQGMSVEVLATAGSEAKRRYLSELGIACVMDSRTLAFADETMRYTGGRGVDAVLNSLPGEAIAKGLSVLKPGGRFLEIGKRDIYDDAALGLYVLRNNLALFAIDLDQLFRLEPARMGNMLRDLMDRFARQELRTLPVRQFAADRIQDAFRFMQSAQHIGKVVIDFTNRPQEIFAQRCDRFVARSDGTYWIAGGQGGFGLEIARWLVDRGARHLVLTARRSTPTEETLAAVAALQQQGAQVLLQSLDITRMADLRRGLEEIESQMPAIVGVFHTAMVLEDRLLVDLDPSTLQRVLAPKVAGGWNLHRLMEDRPLDCFVLFSSLSSVFG
ncbi:MAG: SDR family NAD(P)-dependent oxidoreductase, partial [Planctomycetota bacterium]